MEGFALRDAGDEARAPLALRPVHLALVAFVSTLPAHAPTIRAFAEAPQFEAIADTFLFALLLAAVTFVIRSAGSVALQPSRPLARS